MNMIDSGLIEGVKAKDELAFQKLYEQYVNYVFVVVKGYVTEPEDQKDVIQEIFARVFLSVGTYDPMKGEFKYWIRKVAVNCCFQFLRKKRINSLDSLDSLDELPEEFDQRKIGLTKNEIVKLLDNMPKQYREILVMSVLDDYSHAEISQALGITPKKSRLILYRALKWIRENKSHTELSLFMSEITVPSK